MTQNILQHLMSFRNEWKLYRRTCSATGDEIISAYHSDTPFPVYKNEIWWGDTWDATNFGMDFDTKKPFFDQFHELQKVVPREGTSVFNSENCQYNSHIRESKNGYLNSLVYRCEDAFYSYWIVNDRDIGDFFMVNNSECVHECIDCEKCFDCTHLGESANCSDCHFSYQLRNCQNCIACTNLTNKKFHIFNKKVSREEFFAKKSEICDGKSSTQNLGKKFLEKTRADAIHRATHNLNTENCSGDHLQNCKNCKNCFDSYNSEDCENSISVADSKNIVNSYSAGWPSCELVRNSLVTRGSTDIAFCNYTWFSSNLEYCDSCVHCTNCFGCIGLRHKKFHIFNKPYSKKEYFVLRNRIVEHMKSTGEWEKFFPKSHSPFAYNESAAQDFYPLEKNEALALGWNWRDAKNSAKPPTKKIEIPDSIAEVADSICEEILTCELCQKNYKIIPAELKFYRKMNAPIPKTCPDCRHATRLKIRNPRTLFLRKCDICEQKIYSTFVPDRPEKIACESCFLED